MFEVYQGFKNTVKTHFLRLLDTSGSRGWGGHTRHFLLPPSPRNSMNLFMPKTLNVLNFFITRFAHDSVLFTCKHYFNRKRQKHAKKDFNRQHFQCFSKLTHHIWSNRGSANAWDTALTPGSACDIGFNKIFNSKKMISSLLSF